MSQGSSNSSIRPLEMPAEQALLERSIEALVALSYEDERPFQGLCGQLDWRFYSQITDYARRGILTGKVGECLYIPAQKQNLCYHLLITGAGKSSAATDRTPVPKETIEVIKKNIKSMQLKNVGVSMSDFGRNELKFFKEHFKETGLWVTY